MDLDYTFISFGISRDMTRKFSIQGLLNYVSCSGTNESGNNVNWSQLIPTCALKYSFNDSVDFIVAYTLYSYNSDTPYDVYDVLPDPGGNNNYNANRIFTRFKVKF